MWRVYRRTRKNEDYANYKEALNLATTEIRKSKRTFEKKLAGKIKNYSTSFYAYVRSKQKVRDKVEPLENNSGNIISDGLQMAEVLNEYFSSVFTTEDISSLPVQFTKFEGNKSEHLTRFAIQAIGPDGKWTRKPLAYRESNNVHLLIIICPPKICVNLVFKHIHAASRYTICRQFVPFIYCPL